MAGIAERRGVRRPLTGCPRRSDRAPLHDDCPSPGRKRNPAEGGACAFPATSARCRPGFSMRHPMVANSTEQREPCARGFYLT